MESEKRPSAFESEIGSEDQEVANKSSGDHGWQKVTYAKRQRKQKQAQSAADVGAVVANGTVSGTDNVFRSLEQQAEDRRRRILEAQRAAAEAAGLDEAPRPTRRSGDNEEESEDSDDEEGKENRKAAGGEEKKAKPKKPKKPKVTVAEAAANIDFADLTSFLVNVSASYEGQQEIQLMRFADYYGRAFAAVGAAQFPWMKMIRESSVAKIADVPLSHIPDAVYKTSVDWLSQHSIEALGSFILWCLDTILADLASQQAAAKGVKKGVQHASSKSQVAIFVVLAMALRRKPDALVHELSTLRENLKYQGQDKLPVIVWMISQASQGDLAVGLYAWSHNLLPLVNGKSFSPQSRDLILQVVERILSAPKARTILVNSAVRKGERLMPPSALETLMRVSFPSSSARVKATERFEAIYPTLKEVALAGSSGSKAMRQIAQQIMNFAFKAAGESIPQLSHEATSICIWCLCQSADCYKQWEKAYEDNLEASIAIVKKLTEEWKQHSANQPTLEPLRDALKSFRQKNEKALASGGDASRQALYKDADKYCKVLSGRLSRTHGCIKGMAVVVIAFAVGAAVMSPSMESWDLKKLSVILSSHLSL